MGLRHVGKESVDAAPQDGAEASTGFDYLRLPPEVRDMVRSNLDKPTLRALSLTGTQAHIDDLRTRLRARQAADREAEKAAGKIYDATIPDDGIPGHPYLHTDPEASGNDDLVAADTYVDIVGRLARHLDDDRQKDFVEKIRSADDSIKFECLAAIGRYVGDFKPHNWTPRTTDFRGRGSIGPKGHHGEGVALASAWADVDCRFRHVGGGSAASAVMRAQFAPDATRSG